MFKKISEAYAILSNPQRRKKYDLWGETENNEQDDDLENMFGDIFGSFGGFGGGFGGMGDEDDFEEFINNLE